ncbi:hypothetical protein FGO68_gene2109 [Halteria grandinella]|uniref:Major facilitator superfamily (MFS) profile domain-containing protein n=1 Tax=Halteria grandinella TaxID=5974 RepID=A0A8J8NXM3_HALGN|nr:hypothetical protein FGO68_gene2109 [Halteria grandinella]
MNNHESSSDEDEANTLLYGSNELASERLDKHLFKVNPSEDQSVLRPGNATEDNVSQITDNRSILISKHNTSKQNGKKYARQTCEGAYCDEESHNKVAIEYQKSSRKSSERSRQEKNEFHLKISFKEKPPNDTVVNMNKHERLLKSSQVVVSTSTTSLSTHHSQSKNSRESTLDKDFPRKKWNIFLIILTLSLQAFQIDFMMQLSQRNFDQIKSIYTSHDDIILLFLDISPMIGMVISLLIAPYVLKRWRRKILLFTPISSIIAIIVQALSIIIKNPPADIILLCVGRFIQGLSCGLVMGATYRSVEEYVPNWVLAPYFAGFLALNSTLSTGLHYLGTAYRDSITKWKWAIYLFSPAILISFSFIGLQQFVKFETPLSDIAKKGKSFNDFDILPINRLIYKDTNSPDSYQEIQKHQKESTSCQVNQQKYEASQRKINRNAVISLILLALFQQASGVPIIMQNLQQIKVAGGINFQFMNYVQIFSFLCRGLTILPYEFIKDFRRKNYMIIGSFFTIIFMFLLRESSDWWIQLFLGLLIGQYLAIQDPIILLYSLETSVNWVYCIVEVFKLLIMIGSTILIRLQPSWIKDKLKIFQICSVIISLIGIIFIMKKWINDTTFLTHKQKKEGVFDWDPRTRPPKGLQRHSEEKRYRSLAPNQEFDVKANDEVVNHISNTKSGQASTTIPQTTNSVSIKPTKLKQLKK